MKRKWKVLSASVLCAFALLVSAQVSYASNVPGNSAGLTETDTETDTENGAETPVQKPQKTVYTVKVKFQKNGGKGSMSVLPVASDKAKVKLTPNKYTRTGYVFTGWALKKNGSVVYKNKANVKALATEKNNGKTITLYAQWKPITPKIKRMSSSPSKITVKYSKNSKVDGYQIMYSENKKFSESKTVTMTVSDEKRTSADLLRVVPNRKYYVKVRSYKKTGSKKIYSDWSKVATHKVKSGRTLANTKADYGIEADVKLNGSGSGYHAKLVIGSPYSAVSFGMQYDVGAANPYGSRNMALIENIASNDPGGQQYTRPGDVEFQLGKSYHLMITMDDNGNGDVYVDYRKIGSFSQRNLKNASIYLWLEVSGRLNGDGVDAEFANIKYKDFSGVNVIGAGKTYSSCRHDRTNAGLKCKYDKKKNAVRMYGKIQSLSGDWDSAYNGVSYRLHVK